MLPKQPSMWDRRRTATSTSSLSARHKQRLASHHRHHHQLLDTDHSTPFNALGISNAIYKYRIHAGKVVPDLSQSELPPLPHDIDNVKEPIKLSTSIRHTSEQTYQLASELNPTSPLYDSDTESELYQGVVSPRFASGVMSRLAPEQISPPSSPEAAAWGNSLDPDDVSPIDEDVDGSGQVSRRTSAAQKLKTNLPMPRRDRQASGQRDPNVSAIPQPNTAVPSFGQRMKRLAKTTADSMENRPPWKGASGREAQMKPIRDDLTVTPLNIPGRSGRRSSAGGPTKARTSVYNAPKPEANRASTTMRKLLPVKETKRVAQAYPSPPPGDSLPQPQMSSPSPVSVTPALSSMNSIRRKPPPSAHVDKKVPHAHPLTSSPVYSSDEEAATSGTHASASRPAQPTIPQDQPPSHFSVTTRGTSEADTPRLSESTNDNFEQMNRPFTPNSDDVRRVLRSEHLRAGSDSPLVRKSLATSPRPLSIASTSKPLPPAPPEVDAVDRVEHLNAQLRGLANRRININRGIKQMTELMPLDNLLAGEDVLRRREEEKKKIEVLKLELSEVQREEYELGMMLHRAYKRQNKGAAFEPTTLWVRRVTS